MYTVTAFGSLAIPSYGLSQDIGSGAAPSPLVQLPGGNVFDPYGADPTRLGARQLAVDFTLIADTQAALVTAYRAWLAAKWTRGTLKRRAFGSAQDESVTARLDEVKCTRKYNDILALDVSLAFTLLGPVWSGAAHADTTTLNTSPKTLTAANGGNARVTNPIITVAAVGTAITAVTVAVAGVSSWTYTGTIAAGQSLVVDCGSLSVKNNGANAYSGFALSPTLHLIDEWLRIEAGGTSVVVTITGGGTTSTVKLEFSDGWA